MSDKRPSTGQKLAAYAYLAFCAVLRIVDVRIMALLGQGIGYLAWALIPSRRRIVERNLRITVDPTLRGSRLRSLSRRNIVRTCMNMACTFKTGLMTDTELQRSATIIGGEQFETAAEDRGCIVGCIPHAGNWEMLARIRPLFPKVKRFGSMYRRLDNPVLEDIVYKSRTKYGCEMFSSQKGLKEVFRLANEGGMLGVLSDQFTQQGLWIPYFGKVTGTTPLPSLIYKRCKGRGKIFAIGNSTIGLGKWKLNLGREVQVSPEADDAENITQAVNLALEEAQKESILDGFWMHHRWKATQRFAPSGSETLNELIRVHARLPFRIIICVPESFEEALTVIPMMRSIQACRPDMQLTVLCPAEQKAFWQTQPYITYVTTTDEAISPVDQLEADELYKDGPYDYLFMLSSNVRVFRNLQRLAPLYASGFGSHPCSRKFRTRTILPVGQPPRHRAEDYLEIARKHIDKVSLRYADASLGNAAATGLFIAPFSSLGKADSWEKEKWQQLISLLPSQPQLLALEADKEAAEQLAAELGLSTCIVRPETVCQVLGGQCRLYAVDGLLPQLAALVGCPCHVLMASRLTAVYAPLGEGHHTVSNHTPCHPCYRTDCDQPPPCTAGICPASLLGEQVGNAD